MIRFICWVSSAMLVAAALGGLIGYFAYCVVYP